MIQLESTIIGLLVHRTLLFLHGNQGASYSMFPGISSYVVVETILQADLEVQVKLIPQNHFAFLTLTLVTSKSQSRYYYHQDSVAFQQLQAVGPRNHYDRQLRQFPRQAT